MFTPLTERERQEFLSQNVDKFIPGYTGHCPTLKFHYGKGYGCKTKEILKDLKSRRFRSDAQRIKVRSHDYTNEPILKPIVREKDQDRDFRMDYKYPAPQFITGYTGFVPTLNFRYGKSYGRASCDSMNDFHEKQRDIYGTPKDSEDLLKRSRSAPKLIPMKSQQEVKHYINSYIDENKYKAQGISPEHPPIAGYTGHIPCVKGSEESLSQRYNTVVKRGLTILNEGRQKKRAMKEAQNNVYNIVRGVETRCPI